jgi:hypothetical protein
MQQDEKEQASLKFYLPYECPNAKVDCPGLQSNLQIETMPNTPEQVVLQQIPHSSTSVLLPKKRRERQVIMVDMELRRSLRLKSQNTGFKPA